MIEKVLPKWTAHCVSVKEHTTHTQLLVDLHLHRPQIHVHIYPKHSIKQTLT